MRKLTALLLLVLVCGSSAATINIGTWNQLSNIPSGTTNRYVLKADLDSSSVGYTGLADQWEHIENFSGVFDGEGHSISDLEYGKTSYHDADGLFGSILGGSVSNLVLINPQCNNVGNEGGHDFGFIAGTLENDGLIQNCYVTSGIHSNNSSLRIGGLVGTVDGGTLRNCYTDVIINNSRSGIPNPTVRHGGLVGVFTAGEMHNCFSVGTVEYTGTSTDESTWNLVGETGEAGAFNCGWYNYAGGPGAPGIWADHEETNATAFYTSDHGVYTDGDEPWDTNVWYFSGLTYPLFDAGSLVAITSHPQDIEVVAPASAIFSVTATSDDDLYYQWRTNTVDVSGETNSTYTIASTTYPDDNGMLVDVVVTNSLISVTSDSAVLTITAPWSHIGGVSRGTVLVVGGVSTGNLARVLGRP